MTVCVILNDTVNSQFSWLAQTLEIVELTSVLYYYYSIEYRGLRGINYTKYVDRALKK